MGPNSVQDMARDSEDQYKALSAAHRSLGPVCKISAWQMATYMPPWRPGHADSGNHGRALCLPCPAPKQGPVHAGLSA